MVGHYYIQGSTKEVVNTNKTKNQKKNIRAQFSFIDIFNSN